MIFPRALSCIWRKINAAAPLRSSTPGETLVQSPADFNFLAPDVQRDPMAYFQVLREQAPVYHEPLTGVYMVTRAKEIRYVAEHPELFSNIIDPTVFRVCQGLSLAEKDPEVAARLREKSWLVPHTLLFTDPPIHARYRRLALEALSPKAVKKLVPFIEQQVQRFITPFDTGETIDFVETFTERVPLATVQRFVGAPDSDREMINRWTHQFFSTQLGQTTREEYFKTVDAISELFNYVADRIEAVKQQRDGTLIDDLLHAHEKTGDEALTLEELLSMFQVLMLAGHDTTRQTLASGMRILATDPAMYRQLKENPDQIGSFSEEVIRMYSPATLTPRIAAVDSELAGVKIPKGSTVFVCWGSANRDPDVFTNPDAFQCPRSNVMEHFGFGAGPHFCVGNRLARTTTGIAFNAFLQRYDSITLAVPESELHYMASANLRALLGLPIRCTLKTT
jgi:cytochrome P450